MYISSDRKHIIKKHIYGTPNLVVEIISEGSKKLDEKEKMEVYGKFNVLEYWLIELNEQSIEIYDNENGVMKKREKLNRQGLVHSKAIANFSFDLEAIW